MTIHPARIARLAAFAIWAVFFDYLWLSGEGTRFVGPRTEWVVPFGAIALTLFSLAYATTVVSRGARRTRLGVGELLALGALIAPVAAVLMVPSAQLGTLAVERKAGTRALADSRLKGSKQDAGTSAATAGADAPKVGIVELAVSDLAPELAVDYGVVPGAPVEAVAFVSAPPLTPGGRFEVTRFLTGCCAADALPASIAVIAGGGRPRTTYPNDQWLRVKGRVARSRDGGFHISATSIARASEPKDPYLPAY